MPVWNHHGKQTAMSQDQDHQWDEIVRGVFGLGQFNLFNAEVRLTVKTARE